MTVCIESLDLCLNIALANSKDESLAQTERHQLTGVLPHDPEAWLQKIKQHSFEVYQGLH